MTSDPWSPDEMKEAFRTAIAMALAAWRHDPVGTGTLWNGSTNHPALVWALSRLPSTMVRAVSARDGVTLDPEDVQPLTHIHI